MIRTSNAYQFLDPLDREPGRRVWCKSENPARPQNREKHKDGARLDGARVTHKAPSQAPPEQTDQPTIALRREHAAGDGDLLSDAGRPAIVARQDAGTASAADWVAYRRDLDTRITPLAGG